MLFSICSVADAIPRMTQVSDPAAAAAAAALIRISAVERSVCADLMRIP